jgi:DNA-binding beta-propeller fold protein YncE
VHGELPVKRRLADALALLAQVIKRHARTGHRRVGLVKHTRDCLPAHFAAAPIGSVKHKGGDHCAAGLAITSDGRRGYTSNVGPGTVSVLDLEAKKLLAVIPVSALAQRIALSVNDRWVFTADQTKPQLAVIDTATNAVKDWIPLPGSGYGMAPTPDGKWLVVAMPRTNQAGVIDLATLKVVRTFVVPKAPQEVLIRPDGMAAYVSCDASHQVAVIDLKNWKVERLIDAGPGVDGLAWAGAN